MLKRDAINNDYFEWLYDSVCGDMFSSENSFRKLLMTLHNIDFRAIIETDENRESDGVYLRYRFAMTKDDESIADYICGNCSVLEMMVALAIRCEEAIMDDPKMGNRTSQWFWGMINSLGLSGMYDDNFDKDFVYEVVCRFLDRDYEPDGRGGLFTIKNCDKDLREVEIWYQLCWYLDSFIGYQ